MCAQCLIFGRLVRLNRNTAVGLDKSTLSLEKVRGEFANYLKYLVCTLLGK
jgi:hypothetical protein